MSLRISRRNYKDEEFIKYLQTKNISVIDIEKALSKEGVQLRATGFVSSSNPNEFLYRRAFALKHVPWYKGTASIKDMMVDKMKKAAESLVREKGFATKDIEKTEEYEKLFKFLASGDFTFYRDNREAEKQLTNF